MRAVTIAGRRISTQDPPYVVAELSANHNGDIGRAFEIMQAAKAAGADAVKLQTYTPDTMTIDAPQEEFQIRGGLWDGYSLYDLYKEAQTPWEWHAPLFAKGRELGLTVFSTPFDESAVDLLEELGAPAYKIASFEAIDLALIARCARTRKPMIISTGMANLGEIQEAVDTARSNGARELIVLHCISAYPAPATDANLRTIPHMADAFDVVTGLSDHTLGTTVAAAAVALGAAFIEKHVTMRRSDGGPDSAFSLEPAELGELVRGCRTAWEAVGNITYAREVSEEKNVAFRRSLYIVKDVRAGEAFTSENVRAIRPGYGLPPKYLPEVLGRTARRDLPRGTRLTWDALE
ncbi:pseudaminic acid synthase [Sandaracinus amylolyticus]|uniref:pseudaminic acid synthase n=1 Tax=Sandaracinus amylolyticus TaxID=927083 RepID=UPI001EFFECDA|nr:pseudaminic acid synthase [Sandaracinus amylolyticus]UJR80419.1 Spore coat polysaccharide biosynthesis protein spsE [Sandaracinus amylolyticus]